MNSYDVVGYVYDGAVYCPGCFKGDPDDEDVSPVFADHEFDYYPTCDDCGGVIDEVCSLAHCYVEEIRDIIEREDIGVDSYNETSITINGVEYPVDYTDRSIPQSKKAFLIVGRSAIDRLPEFEGAAWRAESNLLATGDTVGDIVRFETDDLGNADDFAHVTPAMLAVLDTIPAKHAVWVAQLKSVAHYYGDPERYDVLSGSKILAEDGCGGFFVLMNQKAP